MINLEYKNIIYNLICALVKRLRDQREHVVHTRIVKTRGGELSMLTHPPHRLLYIKEYINKYKYIYIFLLQSTLTWAGLQSVLILLRYISILCIFLSS